MRTVCGTAARSIAVESFLLASSAERFVATRVLTLAAEVALEAGADKVLDHFCGL